MDDAHVPLMLTSTQLLAMLVSIAITVATLVGFVLWAARHAYEEHRRVRCPVRHRMAKVLFQLAPDGTRTDVVRCGLFPDQVPTGCGKPCLDTRAT